jgi:hypothetical protein
MSIQKYLYLAVIIDTSQDVVCVAAVTKDTWDTHKMYDDPNDIEDIVSRISVNGYFMESSGMDYSLLDVIEKNGMPLTSKDAHILVNDLESNGFTINNEFAKNIHELSEGLYQMA